MPSAKDGRREFMKAVAGAVALTPATLAAAAGQAARPTAAPAPAATSRPAGAPRIRFGVVGLNHGHIYGQVAAVQGGGGELAAFHAPEDDLAAAFQKRFPGAKRAKEEREILEDPALQLVVSASIPSERAPLGMRVMRHGKDFMVDKPGITTLEQLAEVRRVQQETGRIYSIDYSEYFGNRAVVRASELVKAGAIGRVVQTIGLGPHRLNSKTRPEWFWDARYFGGILCDIAAHQAYHFLSFTGCDARRGRRRAGREPAPPGPPRVRGLRRRRVARRLRHGLRARRLVHPGRAADLGRRPADDPGHRRLHRDPHERRRRRPQGRRAPVPGGRQGDPLRRLLRAAAAVRRAAGERRARRGPRPRCRRRSACSRWSWCCRHRRPRERWSSQARPAAPARPAVSRSSNRRSRWRHALAVVSRAARRSRRPAAGIGGAVLAAGFPSIVPSSVFGAHGAEQPHQRRRDRHRPHLARPRPARNLEARAGADHGRVRPRQPPCRGREDAGQRLLREEDGQAVRRRDGPTATTASCSRARTSTPS